MSETLISVVALLVVILVISLVILARNKNLKQKLRLPGGLAWDIETTDDRSQGSKRARNTTEAEAVSTTSGVDFGQMNQFGGAIGDIAGQDIVETDGGSSNQRMSHSSSVQFGRENVFSEQIGDVAGRNIVKKPKSTKPKAGSDKNTGS